MDALKNLEKIKISFYKYLNNELNEEEARQFLLHLDSGQDQDVFLLLIEEALNSPVSDQLLDRPELTAVLNQSFIKITQTIDNLPENKRIRFWPRMATGVAAAVAFIVLGIYFFGLTRHSVAPHDLSQVSTIKPGMVGATLTLANGQKIKLADAANGDIAAEAGIRITKTADGQLVYTIIDTEGESSSLNTLSTAKGETYMLTLPDQSVVWMNAASSLTYASNLNGQGARKVKLEGEAYFQVAEDKSRPFVVETRHQEIVVLGTHFNINAYANEDEVKTTLLTGSIKVSARSGSKILKPGDQSAVNERSLSIEEVDTERAIAWKNNKFLFENDDIQYIMRMIERWYNVDVVYTGEIPTEKFGGGVSRFDDVHHVLRILESTGGVRFKIEGKKIFVSK